MGSSLVVAGVFIPIIRRLSWGRFHHAFGAEADVERAMSGRRNTHDCGIKAQVETGQPSTPNRAEFGLKAPAKSRSGQNKIHTHTPTTTMSTAVRPRQKGTNQ